MKQLTTLLAALAFAAVASATETPAAAPAGDVKVAQAGEPNGMADKKVETKATPGAKAKAKAKSKSKDKKKK
jgi:hypothetical protein